MNTGNTDRIGDLVIGKQNLAVMDTVTLIEEGAAGGEETMLKRKSALAVLFCCMGAAMAGQTEQQANQKKDVAAAVARMARVGSSNAPSFSPDGKWVSFISNMSGTPQVWIVPSEGGYPRMVTNGDDPVTEAAVVAGQRLDWVAIAPGGGLNTQVYVVKPDGTGMRLLTKGGRRQQRPGCVDGRRQADCD